MTRLWDDEASRMAEVYKVAQQFLDDFLELFTRYEVRLSNPLQRRAQRFMATYRLKPMDACLAAIASQLDLPALASLDHAFERVDGLELWNHHVPEKRRRRRQG